MSSTTDSKPATSANAMGALKNIVIAVVILAGIFGGYTKYVRNSKAIKELREQATALIKQDNFDAYKKAAGVLEEARSIRSSDAYAISAGAEVAALLWVEHGAQEFATPARDLTSAAVSKEINSSQRFSAEALTLIGDGKIEDAEKKLSDLTVKGVATGAIIGALGIVHSRQSKPTVAKSDFKQATDRDWISPRFSCLYGEAFFDGGDFVSAQSSFAKALETNANHVRSRIGKARADIARGAGFAEAQKALDEILAAPETLSPVLKARALAGKAESLLAAGDAPAAEKVAVEAVATNAKTDLGYAYTHFDLGLAQARQKKAEALDSFKAAIMQFPGEARFYFEGASALATAGRVADGETLYAEYDKTQLAKGDAYHIARSDFYSATGDFTKALAELDAALKENEINPETYYKKGYVFQAQAQAGKGDKRKLYDQAREQYEKAVGFRPNYADVFRQIGLMWLDLSPSDPNAMKNLTTALIDYKEARAPKTTTEAFITDVEQRYKKLGGKWNAVAAQWRTEASALLK